LPTVTACGPVKEHQLRFEVYALTGQGKCTCTGPAFRDPQFQGVAALTSVVVGVDTQTKTFNAVSTPWSHTDSWKDGFAAHVHAISSDPKANLVAVIYEGNLFLHACQGTGVVDCGTDI